MTQPGLFGPPVPAPERTHVPPRLDSPAYRAGLAAAAEGLPYRTPEEHHAHRRDWMAGHYWGRR